MTEVMSFVWILVLSPSSAWDKLYSLGAFVNCARQQIWSSGALGSGWPSMHNYVFEIKDHERFCGTVLKAPQGDYRL